MFQVALQYTGSSIICNSINYCHSLNQFVFRRKINIRRVHVDHRLVKIIVNLYFFSDSRIKKVIGV